MNEVSIKDTKDLIFFSLSKSKVVHPQFPSPLSHTPLSHDTHSPSWVPMIPASNASPSHVSHKNFQWSLGPMTLYAIPPFPTSPIPGKCFPRFPSSCTHFSHATSSRNQFFHDSPSPRCIFQWPLAPTPHFPKSPSSLVNTWKKTLLVNLPGVSDQAHT